MFHVFKKIIRTPLMSNKYFVTPELLKTKKWDLPSCIVDSKHLAFFINYQNNFNMKFFHKLTPEHLNGHFNKMKVARAKTVFSHDVSNGVCRRKQIKIHCLHGSAE